MAVYPEARQTWKEILVAPEVGLLEFLAAVRRSPMPKSKLLTAEALAQLGSERLAALLLDAAEQDAALARTLRIEIASRNGAASVATEVDTEIKRLKRGRSFVDRDRVAAIARDLSRLCGAIAGPLADADPEMALERIFDVIDLAPALLDRSDDSDGHIAEAIRAACTTAAELAKRAASIFPAERSAFRACQTYLCDEYGVADGIIADFAHALDPPARAALRSWIEAEIARLPAPSNPDSAVEHLQEWKLIHALADIADAEGDVDAYCAAQQRLRPRVHDDAGMARRLLDAGRAADAYAVIEAAEPNRAKSEIVLADLKIAALTELGRHEEAQALRWAEFTRGLREEPLRELLRRLPDFADVEKEREALSFAAAYRDPHGALEFLAAWPDLRRAASVVEDRLGEIDGNAYRVLGSATERLEAKEPLAAILLYRK